MTSKKISEFNVSTSLANSDLFTFVASAANRNISFSDFKSALGVTGTIGTKGDPLGTPILSTVVANQYDIRNIESTKGIIASLSPQDGVRLGCNFTQAVTGSKIIPDLNADTYKVKTLVGGTNIALSESDDSITIGFNPTAGASKTKVISTIDDFPDAVAGVVTFDAGIDYLIATDITTANRFVTSPPNTVRASSSQMVKLEYTGTGDMFTGTDPNFKIANITVSAPNGNIFNTTSPSNTGIVQMVESNIEACQNVGTIGGNFITRFTNVAFENVIAGGLSFTGANNILLVDVGVAFLGGGSLIDLGTATFNTITITGGNIAASAPGTFFLKGAAGSANINAGGLGAVINNNGFGSGTALSGITTDDARWNFLANNNIPNTRPDALLSFLTPTTTVLDIATPKLVTGTWNVERTSQMTATSGGRATYDGEKNATLPITATLSCEPVSGTNKDINIYLAKNGSVIANSKVITTISSGSPKNQSIPWQDVFANGDYYELWIESVDGTDVQVNAAKLRIN